MKISVIQSSQKYSYWDPAPGALELDLCRKLALEGIEEGFEMIEAAARQGSKLIVTIEGFNRTLDPADRRCSFIDTMEPMDGPLMKRFCKLSGKYGIYIVAGLYTEKEGKAYNSGILFGPYGKIEGVYDKVHLPFGENKIFTPGDKYAVFETEYGNIGILICWDLQFPEAAREVALAGADIIACPTWGWENIYGLCRAYENGIVVAAAMGVQHTGEIYSFCDPSCIVGNDGRILAAGTRFGSQIVTTEVDIRKEPSLQYSLENLTPIQSMRHIRMMQRRPETYLNIAEANPPVLRRYGR